MNKSVGGCIIAGPLSDCRNLIETGWATPRSLIASHKARLATSLAYGLSAAWHRPAKICRYCSTARVPKGNSASKRASVAVVSVPTVCSWRSCQSPFYPMRRPTKQTLARPNTQAGRRFTENWVAIRVASAHESGLDHPDRPRRWGAKTRLRSAGAICLANSQ